MFELVPPFAPAGAQPQAIENLTAGVLVGVKRQTMAAGGGPCRILSIANVIQRICRPAKKSGGRKGRVKREA